MKKEQATRLRLARETLVNLDDRQLTNVAEGCIPWSEPHCCPDSKTATCDC